MNYGMTLTDVAKQTNGFPMYREIVNLLPTPRERDHKNAAATEQTALDRIDRGYGLDIAEAIQLLPTPTTQDGANCGGGSQYDRNSPPLNAVVTMIEPVELVDELDGMTDWGKYAPAIEQWANVIDRPAPEPTDDKGRLNPALVEWMMGYPEGWVASLPRTGALKALGNSIVPHQAAAAWGHLLGLNVFAEAGGGGHLLPTPRASDGNGTGHHGTGGPDLRTVICR